MKTHLLMGGSRARVEVRSGDLVLEGSDQMLTVFTNLRDERLRKLSVYLTAGIELKLTRSDNWEVVIKQETGKSQSLVVTRHRSANDPQKLRQYLGANMKWQPYPKGECILPKDALRLPIFSP